MQKLRRYPSLLFAVIAGCASLPVFNSFAQNYPVKPIRMVVGFPAGTGTDTTARMIAQKLTEYLGQPVVVDNRAGAAGLIAAERVAKSPADGYTLLMMAGSLTVQTAMGTKLPYDLERDFTPVSLVVIGAYVLVVHPSVPAGNVKQLIALARLRPGKLSYGSAGIGSVAHLSGELFNLMAKVKLVHVPYKGGVESVVGTAAGQIDMSFASVTSALPLLETSKLRALAVTSVKRASLMPSIPTLNESGLSGYDRSSWYGLVAPAGVPKDIIAQLNAVIGKAADSPDIKNSFNKQGLEPETSTPERFAAFIRNEIARDVKLIKLAGVKAE